MIADGLEIRLCKACRHFSQNHPDEQRSIAALCRHPLVSIHPVDGAQVDNPAEDVRFGRTCGLQGHLWEPVGA